MSRGRGFFACTSELPFGNQSSWRIPGAEQGECAAVDPGGLTESAIELPARIFRSEVIWVGSET